MLPEKWKEYLDKPLWPNRIVFYLILFIAVLSVFGIAIFIFKNLFSDFSIVSNTAYNQYNTTQLSDMGFFDNERYLLSALVQSLAAVIALVITLSLVAVQLAAQSYSARVIDVYKQNPDMWILLGIYITTIFYGLGLIKIIGLGVLSNYIEGAIFAAYFMGFFAFVCLVPYMWKTLELLKPSTVIKLLVKNITNKSILIFLKNSDEITENDPIQPIIDIINAALERSDYETMRNCFSAITASTYNLFSNLDESKIEEIEILQHIILHIENISMHAVTIHNEEMLDIIIKSLKNIGNNSIQLERNKAENKVVRTLQNIGIKATEQKLEWTSRNAIFALHNLGEIKLEHEIHEIDADMFNAIETIGMCAAEQNLKGVAFTVVNAMGSLYTLSKGKNQIIKNEIIGILKRLKVKYDSNNWNFTFPSLSVR